MVTVEEILLEKGSDIIGACPTDTLRKAAEEMRLANVGAIVIVENDQVLGIVTERDVLVRVVAEGRDPGTTEVQEVMTTPVMGCLPSDDMTACREKFDSAHIRHLLVVDGGEPVGLIGLRDALASLLTEA